MCPKDSDGMANVSFRNNLIWVSIVCSDLSVQKLRIVVVVFIELCLIFEFDVAEDILTHTASFVCLCWFNVTFNNFSVISQQCLVATRSSVLTFIVLPH